MRLGHRLPDDTGNWAEWHWDGQWLRAGNDKNGFLPLFFTTSPGNEIAISSSLVELIRRGAPSKLNYAALSVFFRLGYFLGTDTPFEGIRSLPAGAQLTWNQRGLTVKAASRDVSEYTGTREAALDDFISLFRQSIGRRPPTGSRFSLPLSGGRDSRHILFELVRQGYAPFECVTLSGGRDDAGTDAEIAGEVSASLGIPHRKLSVSSTRGSHPSKGVLTHLCADEHEWFMPLFEFFKSAGVCTYNGVAGTWEPEGGTRLTERASELFDDRQVGRVPQLLFQNFRGDERRLRALLTKKQMQLMPLELAESRLRFELNQYIDRPNPLGTFWFENRERRELGLVASGILGGLPTVFVPYLDYGVVDFMQSLPTRFFLEGPFHHDALIRAFPEHAHIPFASIQTSMIEERSPAGRLRLMARLLSYALKNNHRRIPTALRFAGGRAFGSPSMSYRMTSYLIELEAIAGGAGVRAHKKTYARQTSEGDRPQ